MFLLSNTIVSNWLISMMHWNQKDLCLRKKFFWFQRVTMSPLKLKIQTNSAASFKSNQLDRQDTLYMWRAFQTFSLSTYSDIYRLVTFHMWKVIASWHFPHVASFLNFPLFTGVEFSQFVTFRHVASSTDITFYVWQVPTVMSLSTWRQLSTRITSHMWRSLKTYHFPHVANFLCLSLSPCNKFYRCVTFHTWWVF